MSNEEGGMQNAEVRKVDDLKKRTKKYALDIIRLYSSLPKKTEVQVIGKQFLRSGLRSLYNKESRKSGRH